MSRLFVAYTPTLNTVEMALHGTLINEAGKVF